MNVAKDMLIGAGFTIVNENGNMVNVVEQADNLKNVAEELRENVKMFSI